MKRVSLFQSTPRIVMGIGASSQISDEVKRLSGKSVMIITDPGLVKSGICGRIRDGLTNSGLQTQTFDNVEPDPPFEIASLAAQAVKDCGADIILGVGGGSSLDIAKVASILVTNLSPVSSYFGIDMVSGPGLKTILVPTTAGTGSEVTPIAILSDNNEKLKKGIVSPYLFPSVAVLDPELTVGLPAPITAATGMDALIHAVEAFTSVNATSITDMLAEESMRLISENIRTAFANGSNLEARSKMLEGSLLAGMAFANAGVTAVHAFAYPIGAEFHIPHGVANSIMLWPVMEFNMLGNLGKFAQMAGFLGEKTKDLTERESALRAVKSLRTLAADVEIPTSLSEYGVTQEDIPSLAEGVMKVTRLLANNPRQIKLADAERIYQKVL
ncbi:MAG: iron-containing alcohol dehydrogenase [Pseudomonadota bacterium]